MIALPIVAALSIFARAAVTPPPCTIDSITLRGRVEHVHVCGDRHGIPAIVASGDGGWIHLAPHVADLLASQGYFVVGLDAKAYLSSFTDTGAPLTPANIAADFAALISMAGSGRGAPILIGVSEGAALSVVAASSDTIKPRIAGVIALGLGDMNELAWHFRDSIIYLTKRVPDEPCFHSSAYIDKVSPVPLVLIQSASDEFVTRAEADRLAALARQPKRVTVLDASDHAFTNKRPELDTTLGDSLRWIVEVAGRSRKSERTDS